MKKYLVMLVGITLVMGFLVGCKQEAGEDPLVGTWKATNVEMPSGSGIFVDTTFTLRADGTYESLIYATGTTTLADYSLRGTWVSDDDMIYAHNIEIYLTGAWQPIDTSGEYMFENSTSPYTLAGDSLTILVDGNADTVHETTLAMTRE